MKHLSAVAVVSIVLVGCAASPVGSQSAAPRTTLMCEIDNIPGVVCVDDQLKSTGMCCPAGFTCGGPFPHVGCPSGECCFIGAGDFGARKNVPQTPAK